MTGIMKHRRIGNISVPTFGNGLIRGDVLVAGEPVGILVKRGQRHGWGYVPTEYKFWVNERGATLGLTDRLGKLPEVTAYIVTQIGQRHG